MKKNNSQTWTIAVLSTVVALVFVCFRPVAVEVAYPVERAVRLVGGGTWRWARGFFRGASAEMENRRLRREVAALVLARGDVERLEEENARLRRLLSYRARTGSGWLAAEVLSAGGGAAGSRRLRVGRGSLAGVAEGAVVAVPGGLVGRVGAVSLHTAEIVPLGDPSIQVECVVENGDGAVCRGILSAGEDYLPLRPHPGVSLADVPPRARVVTTGRGGVFPEGLEVGVLEGVQRDDDRGVLGRVVTEVDLDSLEDVFIRREK